MLLLLFVEGGGGAPLGDPSHAYLPRRQGLGCTEASGYCMSYALAPDRWNPPNYVQGLARQQRCFRDVVAGPPGSTEQGGIPVAGGVCHGSSNLRSALPLLASTIHTRSQVPRPTNLP